MEDIPNKGHKPLERLRRGTIPFYFKKISLDLPTVTKKALVQKPIADYFPIRKDKQPDNVHTDNSTFFNIFHQNIAGLVRKKDLLELTFKELANKSKRFNVLCFSETFVRPVSESNMQISGYRLAASYSRPNQKRGGVCIFCKKHMQTRIISFLNEFCEDYIFECCGVEIPCIKCIVVCIYRIPTADSSVFLRKLELIATKLRHKIKYKIVIVGDFNIDILKASVNAKELTRIALNNNFRLHILHPTRRDSCLDQILSNIPEARSEILNLGLSDHETAQCLTFAVSGLDKPFLYFYRLKRDYSPENIAKFRDCLKSLSWYDVYNEKMHMWLSIYFTNHLLFSISCAFR